MQIIEASRAPPTPIVLALVGACSRIAKSRSRSSPIEPTTAKAAPPTSSRLAAASSQAGNSLTA